MLESVRPKAFGREREATAKILITAYKFARKISLSMISSLKLTSKSLLVITWGKILHSPNACINTVKHSL
jgi:hypothetical protein